MSTHAQWCLNQMAILSEGGVWGVPRSALIYTKRDARTLALTGRMPHHNALPMSAEEWREYQDDDHACIKEQFELAGFVVTDETVKP